MKTDPDGSGGAVLFLSADPTRLGRTRRQTLPYIVERVRRAAIYGHVISPLVPRVCRKCTN